MGPEEFDNEPACQAGSETTDEVVRSQDQQVLQPQQLQGMVDTIITTFFKMIMLLFDWWRPPAILDSSTVSSNTVLTYSGCNGKWYWWGPRNTFKMPSSESWRRSNTKYAVDFAELHFNSSQEPQDVTGIIKGMAGPSRSLLEFMPHNQAFKDILHCVGGYELHEMRSLYIEFRDDPQKIVWMSAAIDFSEDAE